MRDAPGADVGAVDHSRAHDDRSELAGDGARQPWRGLHQELRDRDAGRLSGSCLWLCWPNEEAGDHLRSGAIRPARDPPDTVAVKTEGAARGGPL
jgi:hypothetical protein